MMNLLALSLLLTSLFAAAVCSPSSSDNQENHKYEDVVVKEGHRFILVETYDEHGKHNTKISISPPQDPISTAEDGKFPSGFIENAKQKVKRAASSISSSAVSKSSGGDHLGELACEALGKCSHEIVTAIGKGKDKVSEKVHEVVDEKKEVAHEAKGMAKEGIIKKRRIAHEAKEKVEDAYEMAKETVCRKAHEAKQAVKESATLHKAQSFQGTAKQAAEDVYEKAKESAIHGVKGIKETAKTAKDLSKTIRADAAGNVSAEWHKMITGQAAARISRFFSLLGFSDGLDSLMGVVNLLGFSTAYGMCVWVTFISSYVLGSALTRHQFSIVQSKIYPVYFRAMAYCIGAALLGHLFGQRKKFTKAEMFQVYNLLAAISVVLINALFLEPLATKLIFEELKIEKEEGRIRESLSEEGNGCSRGEEQPVTAAAANASNNPEQQEINSRMATLNARLKKLNSRSSFLNILTLMALGFT
uniref:TMEM205-like domain-containing protein n=1 Tax=Manihot esculenta TaxID=3983 RepID=A0A2C9WFV5_MANES